MEKYNLFRNYEKTCFSTFFIFIVHLGFFVCLFVCFGLTSRIFHLYGDMAIADERLQILTDTRHSWPLSSECILAATPTVIRVIRQCYTYNYNYSFYMPGILIIKSYK